MMNLLVKGRFYLNRTARQAKFWKPKHYDAIPHYVKPNFIDIHDTYRLRNLEEVTAQMSGKQFQVTVERVIFNTTDPHHELKGRKAILIADLPQFNLTELQLQRLKVIVGCRYNEQQKQLKLTCQMFDKYDQNYTKVHQMFYEIMMQTKRAP